MISSISETFMVPQKPRTLSRTRSLLASSSRLRSGSGLNTSKTEIEQNNIVCYDEDREEQLIRSNTDFWIIISLLIVYFIANCAFSIIAPFFPFEAETKGMSTTIQGMVFALYPTTIFISSPFVGKYMPKLGVKFSLIAGSFLQGGSLVIFGCLDFIDNGQLFTIYCFALRFVMALGAAASETACLCIISVTFKHRLSTAQGMMSAASGAGLMAGPAIGGVLYKIGGFKFPLIIIGVCVMVVTLVNSCVVPPESTYRVVVEDGETVSFLKTFKVPGIAIMSTVSLTAGMILSFLDPTLTNYVEKLTDNGLSSEMVGLIFLCTPLTYTIFTPCLGYLIDTKIRGRYMTIIGAFLGSGCYLLIGPCPLFWNWVKPNIWLLILSLLALGGLSITSMFVPVLNDMQMTAREAGLPMNLGTDGIISGIYTANFNLGSMIGPTLGGVLTDHLKFPWASSIFGAFLLAEALLLLFFTIFENLCKKSKYKKLKENEDGGVVTVENPRSNPHGYSNTDVNSERQVCRENVKSNNRASFCESPTSIIDVSPPEVENQ